MPSSVSTLDRPTDQQTVRSDGARIVFDRVTFSYRGREARQAVLNDFSFDVGRGEFLCVLGASGCGKTTLLNLVAGFLMPDSGTVHVDDERVVGPNPRRGVVFQEYSLFPWLTAIGNVEFGLKMLGVERGERRNRALQYLDLVDLSSARNRYPFELSGGMKQRVAIARALACRPGILLMDEPFAALDALTRSRLQEEIVAVHRHSQMTVVFVTHNITEAIVLGTRAIVLGNGGAILDTVGLASERPRLRTDDAFVATYERLAVALKVERSE